MRKQFGIWAAMVCVAALLLGSYGGFVLYQADCQERKRVENLAGAVLEEFSEAEQSFVEAVMDRELISREAGAEIMRQYGYEDEMSMQWFYQKKRYHYLGALFLLLGTFVGGSYILLTGMKRRHRKQEERFLYIRQGRQEASSYFKFRCRL